VVRAALHGDGQKHRKRGHGPGPSASPRTSPPPARRPPRCQGTHLKSPLWPVALRSGACSLRSRSCFGGVGSLRSTSRSGRPLSPSAGGSTASYSRSSGASSQAGSGLDGLTWGRFPAIKCCLHKDLEEARRLGVRGSSGPACKVASCRAARGRQGLGLVSEPPHKAPNTFSSRSLRRETRCK